MPAPTQAQLDARMSPTPFTRSIPGDGVYAGQGNSLYIKQGSTVYQTGLQGLGQMYAAQLGGNNVTQANQSGDFAINLGKQYLQSIGQNYDSFSKLTDLQGADLSAAMSNGEMGLKGGNVTDLGTLSGLFKTPTTAGTSETLNTEKNTLGAGVKPGVQPATVGSEIPTHLPGGTATTLFDYYAAKGQSLPAVADRATLFEQAGLGKAAEYSGTAQQNEDLLSHMQRSDYAGTTIGSQQSGGAAVNTTPAGASLSMALSGGDAATTLGNYKTWLSSALGVAESKLSTSENTLNSFFSTQQSPDSILKDEMDRAGVSSSQSTLKTLDDMISKQSAIITKLPDDIRSTLSDVGVSQAQLDRLTVAESKGPTAALKDLMTQRDALSTEIDKAMSFAEKFANTRIAAQAARLSALEWQVTSDKGDYKDLSADAKTLLTSSINDRKAIMTTALTAAKNGASSDVIDSILSSGSAGEALQAAGSTMVTPKKTSATSSMTNDLTSAGSAFDSGVPGKGYNGVGGDGYIDPNLYVALYNAAVAQYGQAGGTAFIKKYPPTGGGSFSKGVKGLNPANIGTGTLPTEISNLLLSGQKTAKGTIS